MELHLYFVFEKRVKVYKERTKQSCVNFQSKLCNKDTIPLIKGYITFLEVPYVPQCVCLSVCLFEGLKV